MSYFLIEISRDGRVSTFAEASNLSLLKKDINFCKTHNIDYIVIKGDVIKWDMKI